MLRIHIINQNTCKLLEVMQGNSSQINYMHDLQPMLYNLEAGQTFSMDIGAIKTILIPGDYMAEGSFIDYTKAHPPQFTLVISRAMRLA